MKEPARLREAGPADLGVLMPLVRAYHAFEQVEQSDAGREAVLRPLLEHRDFGRVWLIECGQDVVGYIALCYGYSIEFEGRDAFVDELYVLPQWRGRGLGRQALDHVCAHARAAGVRALHLEVANDNRRAIGLYASLGFENRERFHLMSRKL